MTDTTEKRSKRRTKRRTKRWHTSAQTIAIHGGLVYLSLRLTFGGSSNPPTWCLISEIVTDLASNEISQCTEWDPNELRSSVQPETPEPKRLTDDVPLATCRRYRFRKVG